MTTSAMSRHSRLSSGKSRPGSSRPSIEYYMRPESRMSSMPQIAKHNDESRAKYAWRLIRQCVREAIDVSLKADIKDIGVNHGIHHVRKILHIDPIQQMVYNKNTDEFITVDGKTLRIFHADGRKKEVLTPEEPFDRLLFAASTNLFVGWSVDDATLLLMNSEFEVVSKSDGEGPFSAAVYNENIGEVVTAGPGFLTSWVFRYGGRHILPRKTCTEGLTENERFTIIVLEETISRSQKAFAACDSNVAVFNLFHGTLLKYKKELHVRNITSMLFFNPLKYLITGAKDGSIKVWDEKWHLQLVFVGHCGPVTSMAIYPFGPNIMSSSADKTIRVWSLETCDEVNICPTDDAVECLGTQVNNEKFFSFSENHCDLWNIQNIHMLHSRIGHRVQHIKTTDHPEYPLRNVLLCKDASIRVVSPVSGDILTSLLMPPKRKLIDAAYAVAEDKLFVCYQNGDIVKADTTTNPCTILAEWKNTQPAKCCNYLLVYEYVITAEVGTDTWAGIKRMAATKGKVVTEPSTPSDSSRSTPVVKSAGTPSKQNANRTLLLGGRRDGHICVFNMDSGDVEFEIEAHGHKGVLSMIANSKADQLISAGLDMLIKIWRLYPYAQESLAPLMTLYCAHTPIYMCIVKSKLAVAFQEHSTATYSVVMYSLKGRNRFDHPPKDDHMDTIVGLTSCQKLKLVASASRDGTIKLWNESNSQVRLIHLNAIPHSISFCSEKGDLLVGVGEHLHKIDYKKYMPKAYRFKMISISFNEQQEEKAKPYDENLVNLLSKEDQKRLKAARSSYKFTHFVDILTDEESEEVLREKKMRDQAFHSLESRDNELLKIMKGEKETSKKPKPTPATKREGFNKYLKIFYNRPKVAPPTDVDFMDDAVKEIMKGPKKKKHEMWEPEKEPTGFFPPSTAKKSVRESSTLTVPPGEKVQTPSSPIRTDGFIPNSVLVKLLFPREPSKVESIPEEVWRPKSLTKEQMAQIDSVKHKKNADKPKKHKTQKFAKEGTERVLVLEYSDDEDKGAKEEEEEEKKTDDSKETSAFMSRMQTLMDKAATPPSEPDFPEEMMVSEQSSSSLSSDSILRHKLLEEAMSRIHLSVEEEDSVDLALDTIGEKRPSIAKEISSTGTTPRANLAKPLPPIAKKPDKPLIKHVAQYKPAPPPPTKYEGAGALTSPAPSIVTRQTSPPPKPKTPLPDFISQFKGHEWFDKYFPNANENTFPKPWSVAAFITMVVRVLRIADFKLKIDVLEAIHMLHLQEGITTPEPIYKVMYSVFNHHTHPPTCLDPDEKLFIRKGLELLQLLGIHDREFYIEQIVQFLDGDKEIRNQVMENLAVCGLKDPHKYFSKELDSWDVWNLDEKDRQGDLRRMCRDWLDRWMTSFKIHLQDTIDRLKKGQTVHGRATPNQMRNSPAPPQTSKSILKKPALPGLVEEGDEEESVVYASPESKGPVTVTFEKPPDASAIENATYIEAINYFCDMELEKYIETIKSGGRILDSKGEDKNTVLVLPKIPGKATLVRLGETHTSKCRPARETSLSVDMKLPPVTARGYQPLPGQLYGFPSCIQLPMKQVLMNPFPSHLDQYDPLYTLQEPVMLMLRTSQKYFVQERSYAPPQEAYGEAYT